MLARALRAVTPDGTRGGAVPAPWAGLRASDPVRRGASTREQTYPNHVTAMPKRAAPVQGDEQMARGEPGHEETRAGVLPFGGAGPAPGRSGS